MARSFTSGTDKIVTSANLGSGATALSSGGWVRVTSSIAAVTYATLIGVNVASGQWGIFVGSQTNANSVSWYVRTTTGVPQWDPGNNALTVGTWYYLSFSYDTTNGLLVYINGVLQHTDTTGRTAINTITNGLLSGGVSSGANVAADIAVWNTNLSTAEHLALATGARPRVVRPTNLSLWWPVDGLQSPEPDLSGGKFNGTLTGTALATGPPTTPFTARTLQTHAVVIPFDPPSTSAMVCA